MVYNYSYCSSLEQLRLSSSQSQNSNHAQTGPACKKHNGRACICMKIVCMKIVFWKML